jgi:mono/diheme cytochrome c family protein
MLNILTFVILVALILLFGWLATRAWHLKNAALKWLGAGLSGLLTLLLAALTVVIVIGFYKLNTAPYRYSVSSVKVAGTAEQIARGEKLAYICGDCHSSASVSTLPLDGSAGNFIAGGPPVGVVYAPNLTPGGPTHTWTDGEIIRAMREGVDNRTRPLIIMPSQVLHFWSDADAESLVAYLRSQPAIKRILPARDLNALAAVFVWTGLFPTAAQPPITQPVAMPALHTPEYGKYMVSGFGCTDCHGLNLAGTSGGFGPAGPNLTVIVPAWKESDFINVFRQGISPTGTAISNVMPWKTYAHVFTDDELKDAYQFLHGLTPIVTQPKK